MASLFFQKRGKGESRLCRSCHLLEHGEEPSPSSSTPSASGTTTATTPAANGKKQKKQKPEMTFADADRCSSCNPDGSAELELGARCQFWYAAAAGSGADENEGENGEDEDQGKKGSASSSSSSSSSSSISSLIKGFGKFVKVSRDASPADGEDEDDEDGENMPPPLPLKLRRQDAFKLDAQDGETDDGLVEISSTTPGDVPVPSIFVLHDGEDGKEHPAAINRTGSWSLSLTTPLLTPPSPGALTPPPERSDASPFAAAHTTPGDVPVPSIFIRHDGEDGEEHAAAINRTGSWSLSLSSPLASPPSPGALTPPPERSDASPFAAAQRDA